MLLGCAGSLRQIDFRGITTTDSLCDNSSKLHGYDKSNSAEECWTHRNKRTRSRGLLFSQRISSLGMERQDGGNKAAKSSSIISVANSIANVCKRGRLA